MPSPGSRVYSKVRSSCIEGTDLALASGYECAVHIPLEVCSVTDVALSCVQKANYHVLAGLSLVSMFWYVGWCIK